MTRISFVFVFLCTLLVLSNAADTSPHPPNGFQPLVNGIDLTGWQGFVANPLDIAKMSDDDLVQAQEAANEQMRSHWQVVNGYLEFDGKGENICTVKEYGDFELCIDWKINPHGDSGIYLRGVPQVQIWDPDDESLLKHGADKGSGGLWNNQKNPRFPLTRADNPVREWNTFYITIIGDRVTVTLNGKLVVDNIILENYWQHDRPIPATGPIELQNHGNKLWFKDLFIRELSSSH